MTCENVYKVERPIYSYETLHRDFSEDVITFSLYQSIKQRLKFKSISFQDVMMHIFPFPFLLAQFYEAKFLLYDLIAGITMLVFHIPQGMAYGLLAGLMPINGLYASFFPPLVYFIFGTSRHLSIGTFSIMALLSSVPVLRESQVHISNISRLPPNESTYSELYRIEINFDEAKLEISIATTLLAGVLQLFMGFAQLGCVMNYVSDAMIGGFTTATSFHVIISQLGQILGYKVKRYSGIGEMPYKIYLYIINIKSIHWRPVVISIICIAILLIFTEFLNPIIQKKLKCPFPIQLVLIVLATIISYYFQFSRKYDVQIVGSIPKGMPKPKIPDITIWPRVLLDAFILAVVAFVMNSALVKIYALKFCYDVDYNQEFVAYGLANIFGSFFLCTMSAGALARSSVVVQVGMKSQVASLISCCIMAFVLLFIGPLFEHVPTAVLSAIIVVSLKSMIMQIKDVRGLYIKSKYDFDVWIVSFIATIVLNVPFGLVTGFLFSLLTIIIRLQHPESQLLGQLPNTDLYRNMKIFKTAVEIPGIKIFRYDAPLYFANAEHFQSKLYKKTGINPRKIKAAKKIEKAKMKKNEIKISNIKVESNNPGINENLLTLTNEDHSIEIEPIVMVEKIELEKIEVEIKSIIVDFSSVNYIDNVAIRILEDIYFSYSKLGIRLIFAGPNNKIRKMLQKSKFVGENLSRIMFVTVHDAVTRILSNQESHVLSDQLFF